MRVLIALLVAYPAFGATIITTPIPITGTGNFHSDGPSPVYVVSLSGQSTDGTVGVTVLTFCCSPGFIPGADGAIRISTFIPDPASPLTFGSASIQLPSGELAFSPLFDLSLSGGSGTVTLYDTSASPLQVIVGRANLIGYVTDQHLSVNLDGSFFGRLSISETTQTPEPSTAPGLACGLLVLTAVRGYRRSRPAPHGQVTELPDGMIVVHELPLPEMPDALFR